MIKQGITKVKTASKFSKLSMSLVVLLVAGVGTYLLINSFAATPTVANLWVDGSGGSCTYNSTATTYSDAAACGSIDAAWDKCSTANETIIIKAQSGTTYPNQTITGDKAGSGCRVIGEDGTNIGVLNISAAYFWLENVTVVAPSTHGSGGLGVTSPNVTLKGVNLHGPYVSADLSGSNNLLWQGGELGTAGQTGGKRVVCPAGGGAGDPEPIQMSNTSGVTFDGIKFHPQDADTTPVSCSSNGYHLEMIRIEGANSNFTLKNSTFDNGDHSGTASIFITTSSAGGPAAHDLLFQNNFFGDVDASSGAFSVHSNVTNCTNFTFAYNTFRSSTGAFQCANFSNNKWIANVGANFFDNAKPCPPTNQILYTNNVWQDDYINYSGNKNCGSDGVTPGYGGTNPGADTLVQGTRYAVTSLGLGGSDGFHLQAGSPAINKGEYGGYCMAALSARDHDGGVRANGARCDAGAHEYGSTPGQVGLLSVSCSGAAHTPGGSDGSGICWPGVDNTGPNADESTMTAYSGSCSINTPNTTIDSKVINCSPLLVGPSATNLVIKNSYLHGGVIQDNSTASFTIQDSKIDNAVHYNACTSPSSCAAGNYACGDPNNATTECGVGYKNFNIRRTEILNTNRAAYCESNCIIEDNYFHGTNLWPDHTNLAHASSVRNEQNLTLRHNAIGCDFTAPGGLDPATINSEIGCSADMSGYADFAPIRDDTIDNNLFLAKKASSAADKVEVILHVIQVKEFPDVFN